MTRVFRALALLSSTALAISVAGVVESTNTNAKTAHAGLILRRVGAIMFGALYVFLIIVDFLALSSRYEIRRRHIPVRSVRSRPLLSLSYMSITSFLLESHWFSPSWAFA